MNNPKFAIGEEVLLVSIECPELNGEYVVRNIAYCDSLTTFGGRSFTGYQYQVDDFLWPAEPALRKKHRPADKSFSWLMSSLGGKVLTDALV